MFRCCWIAIPAKLIDIWFWHAIMISDTHTIYNDLIDPMHALECIYQYTSMAGPQLGLIVGRLSAIRLAAMHGARLSHSTNTSG
jgi:hypothetical protein